MIILKSLSYSGTTNLHFRLDLLVAVKPAERFGIYVTLSEPKE